MIAYIYKDEENKVISLHYMYQYSSNNLYCYSTPVELAFDFFFHFEKYP